MTEATPEFMQKKHDEFVKQFIQDGFSPAEAEGHWLKAMALYEKIKETVLSAKY